MSFFDGVLLRGFAGERTVRLLAVDATAVAERTRISHGLGPDAARYASEGVVASVLMSAQIKGEERIALQLQNSRPRFAFMGEVDADGNVRARLTPPDVHQPRDGKLEGMLLAIKSDAVRELYRGHSIIEHASIEEALSAHLEKSSQLDVVLRILVELDDNGAITRALGLLVERMPSDPRVPSLTKEAFEAQWNQLHDIDAEELLMGIHAHWLADSPLEILERRGVQWRCRCSAAKVESTLLALGRDTLREMIEEEEATEVTCHFCNQTYRYESDDLVVLVARLPSGETAQA